MARYRVVHWQDIPSLVEAAEGDRTAQRQLSQRFQDLIDALAMRDGSTEEDAYLEGWGHGEWMERAGGPDGVADAVAAGLERALPTPARRAFPAQARLSRLLPPSAVPTGRALRGRAPPSYNSASQ